MDWFERIAGFKEQDYATTQSQLSVADGKLVSLHSRHRWAVGKLETPDLGTLRFRCASLDPSPGPASFRCVAGDVRKLHRTAPAGAMFQVASQFNLLEMIGPTVTPEHGVTRYQDDPTQGPACAIAAGAATIYRNYFVPFGDGIGQRADRQIDCLRDLGDALGNQDGRFWKMHNGYAICEARGLAELQSRLEQVSDDGRDQLRQHLRIGVHRNVDVTDEPQPGKQVSQAFCSALPVSYCSAPRPQWALFAQLVLEAAYEATLRAAALYATDEQRTVFLTRLGGGAFGNDDAWIDAAMRRAVLRVGGQENLDIQLVCYGGVSERMQQFAARLNAELQEQWDEMLTDE